MNKDTLALLEFCPNIDKRLEFPGPRHGVCVICTAKFVVYGDHAHPMPRACSKACALELATREPSSMPLMCRCPQRPYPHELIVHTNLRREAFDSTRRYRWPWSLVLSPRLELSAEERQSI